LPSRSSEALSFNTTGSYNTAAGPNALASNTTGHNNTEKLQQLRPVTFKLKSNARGARQYGLIAEEVAKVYPELVIRDSEGRRNS